MKRLVGRLRRWIRALPLAALWLVAACRQLSPTGEIPDAGRLGHDAAGELGLEVTALDTFLLGRGAVGLFLLFLTLAGVALGMRWVGIWLRARGMDPGGRTTRVITLGLVGFALLVGYLTFLRLVRVAPVLSTAMLLVALTILLVGNLPALQNLISGAGMALRGWVTPGLHVRIGEEEGIVDRTGPLSVAIRTPEGSLILVPNRLFSQQAFALRNASRTAQVAIRYPWPRPVRPEDVVAARKLVLLCPYHQADLDVATHQEGDADRILVLTFHTSTEALATLARTWMYAALDEHVAQLGGGCAPPPAQAPPEPQRGAPDG